MPVKRISASIFCKVIGPLGRTFSLTKGVLFQAVPVLFSARVLYHWSTTGLLESTTGLHQCNIRSVQNVLDIGLPKWRILCPEQHAVNQNVKTACWELYAFGHTALGRGACPKKTGVQVFLRRVNS